MSKMEILLPAMGEGVFEATITKILVSEGDYVEEDTPLIEVATDKVDSEVPAPANGIIEKFLLKENDTPQIGDVIAILKTDSDETDKVTTPTTTKKEETTNNFKHEETIDKKDISQILPHKTTTGGLLSPLVRNIALKEGIPLKELEKIVGTGAGNRITKEDVLDYLARNKGKIDVEKSGSRDEIIEMGRMRSIIADNMVRSKQISPHVTSFTEADMTAIVEWRNRMKEMLLVRDNLKLTITPIIVEAVAKALKDFPAINVSVDGTSIILKKNINIGIATLLPDNNLIVPVVKNADKKDLLQLANSVNSNTTKARANKLPPSDIQGGTFTISNVGTTGNLAGIPIINQPECAILAVGTIKKKLAVVETSKGETIGIRNIMMLTLTYDHRVIDGGLGGVFLQRIAEYLENFDSNRKI